jgi:hypothetical protein
MRHSQNHPSRINGPTLKFEEHDEEEFRLRLGLRACASGESGANFHEVFSSEPRRLSQSRW